jgi:hypothetical protein
LEEGEGRGEKDRGNCPNNIMTGESGVNARELDREVLKRVCTGGASVYQPLSVDSLWPKDGHSPLFSGETESESFPRDAQTQSHKNKHTQKVHAGFLTSNIPFRMKYGVSAHLETQVKSND